MSHEVATAVAIAGWIPTFETSLVLTGAVVPDARLAKATATRWWYLAPLVAAVSGGVSAVSLSWRTARVSTSSCGRRAEPERFVEG